MDGSVAVNLIRETISSVLNVTNNANLADAVTQTLDPVTIFTMITSLMAVANITVPGPEVYQAKKIQTEYDYIVVGGGTTGCLVARRLSDDPRNYSVLLIEAGGVETPFSLFPALIPLSLTSPIDWQYRTVPQTIVCPTCIATNRSLLLPAGKALGGTMILSFHQYIRGDPTDFDRWNYFYKCKGWSYNDMLPLMRRTERMQIPEVLQHNYNFYGEIHGKCGEMPVNYPDSRSEISQDFLKSAPELGYFDRLDYNDGRKPRGFSMYQMLMDKGLLNSPARMFILPIVDRPNLHITLNSLAEKIITENKNGKVTAVGVQYRTDTGEVKTVRARKEVVISAGAFRSPQLLKLSGIGPRTELEKHNIEVVVENDQVGKNFHDHSSGAGLAGILDSNNGSYHLLQLDYLIQFFKQHMTKNPNEKFGPYSIPYMVENTFYMLSNQTKDKRYNDIEAFLLNTDVFSGFAAGLYAALGLDYQLLTEYYGGANFNKKSLGFFPVLLQPKSRGEILLASANASNNPIVDFQYLSDSNNHDLNAMVDLFMQIRDVMNSQAMRKWGLRFVDTKLSACSQYDDYSRDYFACLVKQFTHTSVHFAGSCRMGHNKNNGCVDPKLRVYGVKNLRVADASIMPEVVTGHMLATCFAIAEKCAQMILHKS